MQLFDVQKEGLRRSAGARGFGYFMEQGLGKTLTAEADYLERVAEGNSDRSIVVCPNSFKGGWVSDAEKHGLEIDQMVYESGSNAASYWANKAGNRPKQLIINYEAIRSEETMRFLKGFMLNRRVFGIFDESIKLKTFNSAQTKAAIELSKDFSYSRILSGKPVSQGPHDLWAQMRVIGQLNGREYYPFKGMFCKMGGFKMKQVMGVQNEDFLRPLIEPHVFRATKLDWTDLPPKLYTSREYRMTGEMLSMYKQMHEEFVVWLNESEHVSVDAAITKYIKLAQIQCGWIYDNDGKVRQLVEDEKNPRLNLLADTIEEEIQGKVIIVFHHKPVYDQLMRRFKHLNPAWIKGLMKSEDVESQKRRFNEDDNCRAILLQDDASKYGHTLLGNQSKIETSCFNMLFYENSYSLDTRSQIEDRNHRHGQTMDSVLYTDLIGTPLDRDCVAALVRKESVFQAIFGHLKR